MLNNHSKAHSSHKRRAKERKQKRTLEMVAGEGIAQNKVAYNIL
jgi:hypothetical protein